jgi:hypothetical protein
MAERRRWWRKVFKVFGIRLKKTAKEHYVFP